MYRRDEAPYRTTWGFVGLIDRESSVRQGAGTTAVYAFEAAHDAVPGAVQEYVPQAVAEILRPLTEGLRRVVESSGGVASSDDSGGELRGHVSQCINMLDTCGTSSSSSVLSPSDSTVRAQSGGAVCALVEVALGYSLDVDNESERPRYPLDVLFR
eukprot:SAG11_NODE_2505_length_3274_cov_9.450882_3_plen_156_part_00